MYRKRRLPRRGPRWTNHAFAALRYLIATIDPRRLGKRFGKAEAGVDANNSPQELAADEQARRYSEMMFADDEKIWRPLGESILDISYV